MHKITLITPSFNQASTLEQTIHSVLEQRSFCDIQYIVVDGNSSDGSKDILHRYQHCIDVLIIEDDRSQSHALNKAFRIAIGDILGWINSDDFLQPNAIQSVLASVKQDPHAAAWIGSTEVIRPSGTSIAAPWMDDTQRIGNWYDQAHFFQPSCFFSRSHFERAGAYVREDLKCVFDVELWMRLITTGSFALFPDSLVSCARVYPEAITQALPVRREIEFLFINFLHYGYDVALRRLTTNPELLHQLLDLPGVSGRELAAAALRKAFSSFGKKLSS